MTSPKPITLEEQIEAIESAFPFLPKPPFHPSMEGWQRVRDALEAAAATLWELRVYKVCQPALGDHKICPTCGAFHD